MGKTLHIGLIANWLHRCIFPPLFICLTGIWIARGPQLVLIEQVGVMLTNSQRKKVAVNTIYQPTGTITRIPTKTTPRYIAEILIKLALNTNHSINQLNHIVNNYLVHFLEKTATSINFMFTREKKLHWRCYSLSLNL